MRISVEPGAEEDLDRLWDEDEDVAADIAVLLESLEEGPDWLWKLTRPEGYRHYGEPQFDTVKFSEFWKQNFNLYRLKPICSPTIGGYRIIYACNNHTDTVHVLAIVSRDFNYDANSDIVKRVVADYAALGIYGSC